MAYDKEKEATIVISRLHHTMLKDIAEAQKRKIKTALELTIEEKHKAIGINTNKTY